MKENTKCRNPPDHPTEVWDNKHFFSEKISNGLNVFLLEIIDLCLSDGTQPLVILQK